MDLPRILIVDDDPNICSIWQSALAPAGYHLNAVTDGARALEMLDEFNYDLVLID